MPTPTAPGAPSAADAAPMVLAQLTLAHVSAPRLVEIAAHAGYDAVTLNVGVGAPGAAMPATNAPMLREVVSRLADTRLRVHDVAAGRLHQDTEIERFAPIFEAGALLRARYAVVVCEIADESRAVDRFGRLADRAAQHGIALALEFMAYSAVRSLADAIRLLRGVARPNAVLMLDALHLFRSGGTIGDVAAVPVEWIPYLQICDAPRVPASTSNEGLRREALTDRLFPGQGGLPLQPLLSALPSTIPLSIEAPVAGLAGRVDDVEIARQALAHTRAVCARTRETAQSR